MPDDGMSARIKRLEDELADVKAAQAADQKLRRDAEREVVPGLLRLQRVKRLDRYPGTGGTDGDEE